MRVIPQLPKKHSCIYLTTAVGVHFLPVTWENVVPISSHLKSFVWEVGHTFKKLGIKNFGGYVYEKPLVLATDTFPKHIISKATIPNPKNNLSDPTKENSKNDPLENGDLSHLHLFRIIVIIQRFPRLIFPRDPTGSKHERPRHGSGWVWGCLWHPSPPESA